MLMKEKMKNPKLKQKFLLQWKKSPNKLERKMQELLKVNNLPFEFVGNGETIIGLLVPDFISIDGSKRVIELFGDYWHHGENSSDKIDAYKKHGYDCLVVWEHDFKSDSQKVLSTIVRWMTNG